MFDIAFELDRSTTIERPASEVFSVLGDFERWQPWSPWLCQEPDCPVRVSGRAGTVGHRLAWDGRFIGSGRMTLAAVEADTRLRFNLEFLKPWKSRSRTAFELAPRAGGVRVTWSMQGSLPPFLFFMRRTMRALVGEDYRRGLAMLKEWLETGTVLSVLEHRGVEAREALHWIGRRRACTLDEIGERMGEDMAALAARLEAGELSPPDYRLSLAHRFDPVERRCVYTAALGYARPPGRSSADLERGELPAHRALRIDHRGAYRHLGNAWAAAIGCARARHKADPRLPRYQIYLDEPTTLPEAERRTSILVPVKR